MCSGLFVEQTVFAFAGGNVKLVLTYHIIEFIGVNAGSIDDDFRLKGFRCVCIGVDGLSRVTAVFFLDGGDFGI